MCEEHAEKIEVTPTEEVELFFECSVELSPFGNEGVSSSGKVIAKAAGQSRVIGEEDIWS